MFVRVKRIGQIFVDQVLYSEQFLAQFVRIQRVCDLLLQCSPSPPEARRLQKRYSVVEPTNNEAERVLRSSIILLCLFWQVVSGYLSGYSLSIHASI